jgi:hypothetical protein
MVRQQTNSAVESRESNSSDRDSHGATLNTRDILEGVRNTSSLFNSLTKKCSVRVDVYVHFSSSLATNTPFPQLVCKLMTCIHRSLSLIPFQTDPSCMALTIWHARCLVVHACNEFILKARWCARCGYSTVKRRATINLDGDNAGQLGKQR